MGRTCRGRFLPGHFQLVDDWGKIGLARICASP
jgi:hypothetical protein